MGRPQFTAVVERPTDEQLRTDGHQYVKNPDNTITSGFETPVQFSDFVNNESRILESVSIRTTPMEVVFRVSIVIYDGNGNPKRWVYAQHPEGLPFQFDPGIRVPEGSAVDVLLRQESGGDVDVDVVLGHREVP